MNRDKTSIIFKNSNELSQMNQRKIFTVTDIKYIRNSYQIKNKTNFLENLKSESNYNLKLQNKININNTNNTYISNINSNRENTNEFLNKEKDLKIFPIITNKINKNNYKEDIKTTRSNNLNTITTESVKIPQILTEEEKETMMRDINLVNKLVHWENDHLVTDINEFKKKLDIKNNNSDFVLKEIRKSLSKLDLKNISSRLKDFYNTKEKEQVTILIQNMNSSKLNFKSEEKENNYEKVNNNNLNTSSNKNSTTSLKNKMSTSNITLLINSPKKSSRNLNIENKIFNFVQNDETLQKFYEWKSQGKEDMLPRLDDYRQIMKDKNKLENSFLRDLNTIQIQIYQKKKDFHKLRQECRDIQVHLQDLKETQKKDINEIEKQIEKIKNIITENKDKFMLELNLKKEIENKYLELTELFKLDNSMVNKYSDLYKEKNKQSLKLENEIKYLKFALQNLKKEQKSYFLEILLKGIDVRQEGLTWVIRKLIELNTLLEYSIFPRFLDHEQMDYLIKISHLSNEITQIKIILKILKNKTKQNKNNKNSLKGNLVNGDSDVINPHQNYLKSFSNEVIETFDNIYKNNNFMKMSHIQRIDDESSDAITQNLKRKIKLGDLDDDDDNILEVIFYNLIF